jgi:flagellar hook-associated protein 1 FlgK
MSLFAAIRIAGNTLQADQIAMQVIGQNIANTNTPGYIREEVVLAPAPTQRKGNLLLGMGVDVKAVVQKIDNFLEERLRGAVSDVGSSAAQEQAYAQLEGIIGELTDNDLSTAMTKFFSSISDVLNQPADVSARNMVVLLGGTLTDGIRQMANRVQTIRSDVNDRVIATSEEINRLVEDIRLLNVRITQAEGGDVSNSDAVGLRDRRLQDLEDLAKIIPIRVREQPSGGVVVYSGGDFLVSEGISRKVHVVSESDRGMGKAQIRFIETDSPVDSSNGELHGLMTARDDVLGGYLTQLDEFTASLAFEFNKIYSGGQGIHGFDDVTSESYVTDGKAALNDAGLKFTPVNGTFQVMVYDKASKITKTTDIRVNLNGVNPREQTTLEDLAAQLTAVDGITATPGTDGRLTIQSDSTANQFTFSNDTSGVLAALGINTFFTGSLAFDVDVSGYVTDDPAKFAASDQGIGAGTGNATRLAAFINAPIASKNNASIATYYQQIVSTTTQGAAVNTATVEGARAFEQTLRGQKLATSGVSIDEEAIRMMSFQKQFAAAARLISVANELLDLLVKI